MANKHVSHLCSLVLLIAVRTRPVSSHRARLRALEAARLLQRWQAPGERALLLVPLAGLPGRRAWLLSHGRWRRHLWTNLFPLSAFHEKRHMYGAPKLLLPCLSKSPQTRPGLMHVMLHTHEVQPCLPCDLETVDRSRQGRGHEHLPGC